MSELAESVAPDFSAFSELVRRALPPKPISVAEARRLSRSALTEEYAGEVVDDVLLVASELVTNALLHSGGTIGYSLHAKPGQLLVQVTDQSPHAPRLRSYGGQARTGRGMALIEALSSSCGYVFTGDGKLVWAVVATWAAQEVSVITAAAPSAFTLAAPARLSRERVDVELRRVPQVLHAAWRQHAQALLREYLLAKLGDDDGCGSGDEVVRVHAEATDAIAILDEHLPRIRPLVDFDPDLLGLQDPEMTLDCVQMPVPRASVPHFAVLDRVSDAATELAVRGVLLTPPPLPEIVAFRRWVCHEVATQAAEQPASPWRLSLERSESGPCAVDPQFVEVTHSARPLIAVGRPGLIVAASSGAELMLGYESGDMVGLPVICIIPERFRQAHLAGMSMYGLTDRRTLIGRVVPVSVLHRDGTEVAVELVLSETVADPTGSMALAELRPFRSGLITHSLPA